jgi:hypothetical protein
VGESVKKNSSDLVKYQNNSYDRIKKEKKSPRVTQKREIDDTSIYEYDVECLKRRELFGHPYQGFRKE